MKKIINNVNKRCKKKQKQKQDSKKKRKGKNHVRNIATTLARLL